jgi:hypothetical protein
LRNISDYDDILDDEIAYSNQRSDTYGCIEAVVKEKLAYA